MPDESHSSPESLLRRLARLDLALRQALGSVSQLQGNLDSIDDNKNEGANQGTVELLQLEQELDQLARELKVLQRAKSTDHNAPSASEEFNAPKIINRTQVTEDNNANRMIVGILGKGNLKVALQNSITTIGREPDNDLQIRSRFVSRFHARIVNDDEGAIIEDLDSVNGISVNTNKVARQRLYSGDFIKIGRVHLQYIDIGETTPGGNNA